MNVVVPAAEPLDTPEALRELAALARSAEPHLVWVYSPDLEVLLRQLRLRLLICQGIR
jgi:hypothetical protein